MSSPPSSPPGGDLADFKRECEGLVREYFTHGVLDDVETSLRELLGRPGWTMRSRHRAHQGSPLSRLAPADTPAPALGANTLEPMVVKRCVVAALDRGAREREMAAQLLRALASHGVVSRPRREAGFDLLLAELESLAVDVPSAPDELTAFLARAVVDGVVSEEFLDECADAAGLDDAARACAVAARGAVKAPGAANRVANQWGGPEGGRSADAARREMSLLIREYVASRDAREASRRLAELHVPFYHHELVRATLALAVEEARREPRTAKRCVELLGYLGATGAVSGTQFAKGFARVAVELRELELDCPGARDEFQTLVREARSRGLLPAGLSAWASVKSVAGGGGGSGSGFGNGVERGERGGLTGVPGGGEGGANKSGAPSHSGLRGHLVRLDSAPDLIALARTLGDVAPPEKKANAARPTQIRSPSRMSPAKQQHRGAAAREEGSEGAATPAEGAATPASGPGPAADEGVERRQKKNSDADGDRNPRLPASGSAAVLSALPTRVSRSDRVDANWSGLRAPRRKTRDAGATHHAFSGSDSDAATRARPKNPLPPTLILPTDESGGGGAGTHSRAKPPGGSRRFLFGASGASGGVGGAHHPLLGKCAWKARFQPAPVRCSGEDAFARKSDAALRAVRALRRGLRSAPAGLHQLDTSAHVLSVGRVHTHRPFAAEYDVGEAIGTGGFAVVRKATRKATGEVFAVKTLRVKGDSRQKGGRPDAAEASEASDDASDASDSDSDSDSSGGGGSSDGSPASSRRLAAMSMSEMTNELVMMQQLSGHPNIVTVKEFFTEDAEGHATSGMASGAPAARGASSSSGAAPGGVNGGGGGGVVHVVMELLEGPELVDAVAADGGYSESDAKIVMRSMLDAIAFMHARGVVHRDLKLENLVLARPGDVSSVTLVDFGLAKALTARERAENVCGTLAYVAPEALVAGQYGRGVDVWALGVAMHALLTGTWPFDDEDEDALMDQIIECDLDRDIFKTTKGTSGKDEEKNASDSDASSEEDPWEWISEEAKDLLRGLLEPNPKHRLTAAQALEHAWFTGRPSATSRRLHHVHARLDALAASSRQHPERRFRPGASLAVAGEPSEEVFMITSGWCEAMRRAAGALSGDDAHELVGQRRAGNLVGETEEAAGAERGGGDEDSKSEAKSSDDVRRTSSPVSKLTVTAKTEVRALVFARSDVRWATGHDYRLSDEFEAALRRRRRIVVKQSRLAARAERAAREHAPLFGDADAFAGASGSGRRATSEIIKR